MPISFYLLRLQAIVLFVFIKTKIQSKMINTATVIPCRLISKRELEIEGRLLLIGYLAKISIYNVCMLTCSRMSYVQPNGPLRSVRTSLL